MEDFDSTKYYLGTLCKRGHDWNGTGMSLRLTSKGGCIACRNLTGRLSDARSRDRTNAEKGISCPICGVKNLRRMMSHFRGSAHNLKNKEAALAAGVEDKKEYFSFSGYDLSETTRTKAWKAALKTRGLKEKANQNNATILVYGHQGRITFPTQYWPSGCKYARIIVDESTHRIQINPSSKKLPYTRSVNKNSGEFWISTAKPLAEALIAGAGVPYLEKGKIVIELEGPELLNMASAWARTEGGLGVRNTYDLTIFANQPLRPRLITGLSLAYGLWPDNAPYVLFASDNTALDLFPVTPTGQVALKNGKLGQYIGLEHCVKIILPEKQKRFIVRGLGYFKNNHNFSPGHYKLIKTFSDGRLRFRHIFDPALGRKVTPKVINPVIDHEEIPKQPPSDYVSFDEWEGID